MKKLISLLLAVLLILSLSACQWGDSPTSVQTATPSTQPPETTQTTAPTEVTSPDEAPAITPLLYEVTNEQGHKIWLFGSIHIGRPEFYPLPPYVTQAFAQADGLAVEFDLVAFEKDLAAQVEALQAMIYTDGTTIRDHLSPELYAAAVAILEEAGVYNAMLDYYIPAMWATTIESLSYELNESQAALGVDRQLINAAYEMDKPVLSIESAASQYRMLAGFSPELQTYLLETAVASWGSDELSKQTNMLLNTWAEGNLTKFSILLSDPIFESEEEAQLYAQYSDAMIAQRDLAMADYAETALNEGDALFICVGAAHVVGKNGIADQLENRGYTVTLITP